MTSGHDPDKHLAYYKPLPSDIDIIARLSKMQAIEEMARATSLKGRISGANRIALRSLLMNILAVMVAVIAFAFERAAPVTLILGFVVLIVAVLLILIFGPESRGADARMANVDAWIKLFDLRIDGKLSSADGPWRNHPITGIECGCHSAKDFD
ncbi:hypothetical protein [Sanguibacter inulinus]|jgi:hypothetical protein|uniref:Uncharacterized protein n=1 Tax=Sanguibacter inulinus TaxID=60922 RepID=A0A853EZE7_9MICO|nr:hypothetical protein [Sanguibacter inulinus]MBF0724079.1 hypothetical protein [Sanguibacter inulinus]NYS95224.1 hypothetical protein [Sanguibacter inulinus]